jgi:hypothetical protein
MRVNSSLHGRDHFGIVAGERSDDARVVCCNRHGRPDRLRVHGRLRAALRRRAPLRDLGDVVEKFSGTPTQLPGYVPLRSVIACGGPRDIRFLEWEADITEAREHVR